MGTKTQGTKDEEKHSTICVGHQYAQTQKTQTNTIMITCIIFIRVQARIV